MSALKQMNDLWKTLDIRVSWTSKCSLSVVVVVVVSTFMQFRPFKLKVDRHNWGEENLSSFLDRSRNALVICLFDSSRFFENNASSE